MATLNAGFQDREGSDWGFYHVILPGNIHRAGYALVDLVDEKGLVYVANHLGLATEAMVDEVYGPLTWYHN